MPVMKDASILAVGGCGGMGQAATKLIAENYGAGRLTIADFNLEAAQSWAEGLQKGFVDSAFVDLTKPESFVELFKDYDLVLNLAPYRFNLPIMAGCLKGGCHYVDLGGLFHVTKEQLALDPKFTHLGKTAVLGIGPQ
jgi:saccharopine dehydrogenase (NAD+, L-lysine-forming)